MSELHLPNGATIHYEEYHPAGSPTVLLLHGLGSAGIDWLLQFKPLGEAGYRVLAPDLRGFGQSSWPGRTSVMAMADDMAVLLRELEAAPAHVVGISMGGTVALQLALDHPDLVRRLVLVNTFARLRPQGISGYLDQGTGDRGQGTGDREQEKTVTCPLFPVPWSLPCGPWRAST